MANLAALSRRPDGDSAPEGLEPLRVVAFVDGQNLFHCARAAFGRPAPDYDPAALARAICERQGWRLEQTRFYTGFPDARDNPHWNHFWIAKAAQMGRKGVHVFMRPLRYRTRTFRLGDGRTQEVREGHENGIDVRIAIDLVRLAQRRRFDLALVFSQDQDLSEAATELRLIAAEQGRTVRMASAFPVGPSGSGARGIDRTEWIRIDRALYEACLDPRDYRPRRGR